MGNIISPIPYRNYTSYIFPAMISYGTIVSVAVPSVMGEFGVGQDKAQLLATGFYVAMTISQLVSSWLISKISHYYAYLLSVILFFFRIHLRGNIRGLLLNSIITHNAGYFGRYIT